MRTALISAIVASVGLAVSGAMLPQKSVVVVYGPNTPDSIVQQAKDAIIAAVSGLPLMLRQQLMWEKQGGAITHEYSLISAFAARTTTEVVNSIMALGAQYNLVVEDDQVVHAVAPGS
ncbi:MAG: hypothetical protein M1840_000080 [Geoglossum simile]|nr:MAG: hypothetical protein M1840_000080 [Geoglossum simile]